MTTTSLDHAPLADSNQALLADWFESSESLTEITARHGVSLLALAQWATRPDIAAMIQTLRHLHETRAQHQATVAAKEAIATLHAIAATDRPTNAQEIARRAAAGILKIAFPDRRKSTTRENPTSKAHSSQSPGTAAQPSTAPAAAPNPAPPAATPQHHATAHAQRSEASPQPDQQARAAGYPQESDRPQPAFDERAERASRDEHQEPHEHQEQDTHAEHIAHPASHTHHAHSSTG